VSELDLLNHGLLLASLSLTLLIPALITLASFLPMASDTGVAALVIRRFGLDAEAADDVRRLFATNGHVAGSTTALSALGTMLWALSWPVELARGYEAIWDLPHRGMQDLWRALPCLASFVGVVTLSTVSGSAAAGEAGAMIASLVSLPVAFLWSWWSQHLLLGARVPWRALLPGAVATAIGLFGLGLAMSLYLPIAIVSNFDKYDPIGVIFALLTWLVGFAVVMLGGPVVGHTIYVRQSSRMPR
jgi:membrane protein